MKKPLALIILDGFGNNPSDYGNAINAAKTPNLDRLFEDTAPIPTSALPAWMSACRMDRWATPRWGTPTSAPAGWCIRN